MKQIIYKTLYIFDLTLICVNYCYLVNCSNIDTDFPIVFKPTFAENVENYFGLSVEMQKIENQMLFIIGAPRTNSSLYNVRQSGTVFRCELGSNENIKCNEIDLDFRRTPVSRTRTQNRLQEEQVIARDDMFLGGTLVSRPNSAQVAVCAHKWSQEIYLNNYPMNYMNHQINPSGSCFVLDLGQPHRSPVRIFPMTDSNLQFQYDTYYYSHSMSGFSATFTQSGNHLLLGAPGFYQWRGTILETEDLNSGTTHILRERFLLHLSNRFQSESYAGYAVASGHFLAGIENSVAMGAPRDLNFRGRVYVYNLGNRQHSEQSTSMFSYIDGTQMGEYFGSTLLSVNINNDDYSDLLIGAPFYTSQESEDCGRVYVYLSNGNGLNPPKILTGSESSGSRFGTSIADLGDINLDGYNDIAIGAPYEDDRGAVYIYHGSRNGVITPFAQRISAKEDLNRINLKGFGISISGNRDIDNNFYNDILIGSYLTNKAVLLRTKPIVNIKAEIILNTTQINVNDKNCEYIEPNTRTRRLGPCIRMTYCVKYDGTYVPSSLNLNLTIRLDSSRVENPRCFTHYKNQMKTEIVKTLTISAYSTLSCFDEFIVYLKNRSSIDDIFTPIEFSLSYTLIEIQSQNTFCPKCPIIANNQMTTNQLHFLTGCRIDEKCISNLRLITNTLLNNELNKGTILEGFHKNITVLATIRNSGEPSYLSRLLISSTPTLNLLKQDSLCRLPQQNSQNDSNSYLIECDVGNPLEARTHQRVSIPFDISQLDVNIDRIVFNIELKTASEVTKDSAMSETIVMNVVRNASIQMVGSSMKSEEIYEREDKRKSDFIPFSGVFQIIKQNWSSVENVFIEIEFPSLFNKQAIIYRPYVEIIRGVSVNCNRTIPGLPLIPSTNIVKPSENEKQRRKRNTEENADKENDRKSLILDCNSHINCLKLKCFAGPFPPDKQTAQFVIHSALNIKTIESIFGKKYDTIKLMTESKATILDQRFKPNSDQISTNFIFKRIVLSKETIDNWIIFVSVGAGIIILIIIVLILIKFGFFRRKKLNPEEMTEEPKTCDTNAKIERNSLLEFEENGFENEVQDFDCGQSSFKPKT